MTDVILRISGMDFGACAVRIVCALRGLPGVHAVFVSDTAGCARLTYDEAAVGLGEISRCVQRAGFDVPVETAELRCPGADDGAASRLTALLVLLAIGVGAVWLFWRQPGDLARALTCTCAVLAATCPVAAGQAAGVAAPAEIGRAAERGELLTCGAEASAARTARTVRRCIWLLLAYHAVCLPLAACGVIGPAAAAVLACGASGGVLLCALRGKETKRERP